MGGYAELCVIRLSTVNAGSGRLEQHLRRVNPGGWGMWSACPANDEKKEKSLLLERGVEEVHVAREQTASMAICAHHLRNEESMIGGKLVAISASSIMDSAAFGNAFQGTEGYQEEARGRRGKQEKIRSRDPGG